ncbi:MAG: MFS transporter [Acidobacteriota bacterium]
MTPAIPAESVPRYSLREQRGWCLYDPANSVFLTSGIAVLLPNYFPELAKPAADAAGFIYILGIPIFYGSLFTYTVSFSVAVQVLVLPMVGAIADYGRRKRLSLGIAASIGALAASAMYFLQGSTYLLATALFIVANVAYGASNVVYNSFLPEVAPPETRDGLSSRGWALGYVAGCVMLAAHLALLTYAPPLGITGGMAVRIALGSTGLWWILWTIPFLQRVRDRGTPPPLPSLMSMAGIAFGKLKHTVLNMRSYPNTLKFLLAYLFYNDAVQTVLVVSAAFGGQELGLGRSELVITVLISQFVGIFGALAFNALAQKTSGKQAIGIALVIWTLLLLYAYFFVHTSAEFYIMGGFAGLVMGGTQALSRSTFARLVPKGEEAEYFSIYEIGDKGTSWMGPLVFGLALQFTRSYRIALVSLIIFFLAGLALLTRANVERGEQEVLQRAS